MADEHVIRIEYNGDDGSDKGQSKDQSASREHEDRQRREQAETDAYRDAQRRNQARDEADARVDEINRRIVDGDDSPADAPSPSRELTVYDPQFAHQQSQLHTDPDEFTDAEWAAAKPANVVDPSATAAAGTGDSMVEGAAGISELIGPVLGALGAIVEPAAVVVGAFAGISVAAFELMEALDHFHDNLLMEFENLNPEMASARAEQQANFIQQRIGVGQQIGTGAAETIGAQTGVEKELIEIRGHLVKMTETILYPLYVVVQKGLHVVNWVWHHLPAWLGGFNGNQGGVGRFQEDSEKFLNNLPEFVGGRDQSKWGKRHPRRGDTSFP